jgi:Outer membrane protein beta-barrel domain
MKKTFNHLVLSLMIFTPVVATAQIGGVIEGDLSVYDVSGAYSLGQQLGFSYKTEYGTHYLLGSAMYLEQDDSAKILGSSIDVDSVGFGLAYRYGFAVSENFEPYIEYGWNRISGSYDMQDALGNTVNFDSVSRGDYLAVGILYQLWKDLHLKAEIGYQGLLRNQSISTPSVDALGNPRLLQDTINLSSSIGITFKF